MVDLFEDLGVHPLQFEYTRANKVAAAFPVVRVPLAIAHIVAGILSIGVGCCLVIRSAARLVPPLIGRCHQWLSTR